MAVSVYDSRVFKNLFGTDEIRNVFSDESYVRFMMDTEAALARAQSNTGVIPSEIGQTLTEVFKNVAIE